MKVLNLAVVLCVNLSIPLTVSASEGWQFGIGTGISALDINGDVGFNTESLGPIDFDASIEPDEVWEYIESAFGFGGFVRKGDFTMRVSLSQLELEDTVSATTSAGPGDLTLTFEAISAETSVSYAFAKTRSSVWSVIGGIRYSKQEYSGDLDVSGTSEFSGSVDDSWTDGVIGISNDYSIVRTLIWSNQLDFAGGGSEGTVHFNTALNKIIGKDWLIRAAIDVKSVEYEEGTRGDSDWFYYDAIETSASLSFMYLF